MDMAADVKTMERRERMAKVDRALAELSARLDAVERKLSEHEANKR